MLKYFKFNNKGFDGEDGIRAFSESRRQVRADEWCVSVVAPEPKGRKFYCE